MSGQEATGSDGFNSLLLMLDSNREQAGIRYEELRQRLISYFRHRECLTPEDLADKTFTRVSGKLVEGEEIRNIGAFCFGVARMILKEHWTSLNKQPSSLTDLPAGQEPSCDPFRTEAEIEIERQKLERMEWCFDQLRDEDRQLLNDYSIRANREHLAHVLGTTLEYLRVKVHRLREKLKKCVEACSRDPNAYEI